MPLHATGQVWVRLTPSPALSHILFSTKPPKNHGRPQQQEMMADLCSRKSIANGHHSLRASLWQACGYHLLPIDVLPLCYPVPHSRIAPKTHLYLTCLCLTMFCPVHMFQHNLAPTLISCWHMVHQLLHQHKRPNKTVRTYAMIASGHKFEPDMCMMLGTLHSSKGNLRATERRAHRNISPLFSPQIS